MEKTTCLVIGSGPAGYTAAIYTARANLKPILIEGITPGGQLTTTTEIENFPGFQDGISGFQLMDNMKLQAQKFGADVRVGVITGADLSKRPFVITVDGSHRIEAQTLIVATGATAKYLGLPSEQRFRGMGVSACATCDGFFYRKKVVAVVGGGDTACEEATYLSTICEKVYMIVRRDVLRASKAMQHRVLNTENIEMLWESQVGEVLGDESGVTGLRVVRKDGSEHEVALDGLFLAIGHHPNTELFAGVLDLNHEGYIMAKPGSSHTNVEGVFAAGDVCDPNYRQAITAAGSGCKAAIDAERFLMEQI